MLTIFRYVGQEPVLFAGSVAENVARGRASMEEKPLLTLQEAMRLADQEDGAGLLQLGTCFGTKKLKEPSYQAVEGDVEMGKVDSEQQEGNEHHLDIVSSLISTSQGVCPTGTSYRPAPPATLTHSLRPSRRGTSRTWAREACW